MIFMNRFMSSRPSKGLKVAVIALSPEEKLVVKKAFVSALNLTGFKLIFHNKDLVSDSLRQPFHLRSLWKKDLYMYVPDMEMNLEGRVVGAQHLENGKWEVNMAFSSSAPRYWRECLCDLWPRPPKRVARRA